MTLFKTVLLALTAVACVVLLSCGGSDDDGKSNRLPLNCDQEDCTK